MRPPERGCSGRHEATRRPRLHCRRRVRLSDTARTLPLQCAVRVAGRRDGGGRWRWRCAMYVARFSYSIKPVDRERALGLLGQEVETARGQGLEARLLVPLTRPPGGPALQYELVLPNLDAFEVFREEGVGGEASTRACLRDLSTILLEPPSVELLRIADTTAIARAQTESAES